MYKRLNSKSGMTLVEVLVAMALLTLIVLVFMPLFMNYYKNLRTAGEITKKTYYRASLMERLVAHKGNNDTGYEFEVVGENGIPLVLTDKENSSNKATFTVDGNIITENKNKASNAYITFYSNRSSSSMICFPSSLTDDFLTKDITVVPSGFTFDDTAFNNNGAGSIYHFEVYNTDSSGSLVKLNFSDGYYTIKTETDTDGKTVAVFTFHGGNNVISFENSPLIIKYCNGDATIEKVKVEIDAPEIILVGEAAEDKTTGEKNYFYYATAGVDTETGRMDIVAKKMTGDSALISAMNDVEWVAKGQGDNGYGSKNEYGYYVMGGDAGQVRRFWRNSVGNYYWGGDNLYNYDSYAYYNGTSGAASGSYENFNKSYTTQATFKKIVRANQDQNTTNSVAVNTIFDSSKFSITGADWKAITSNYFTANVTNNDQNKFYVTLGRALNVGWVGGNTTGRSGMDYGATSSENNNLRTWVTYDINSGSSLTVNGYKSATNYEYANDTSLITITSVGAIQIDSGTNIIQENSSLKNSVYPTQSYTLYCGYVPAVVDLWGYTNHGNISGNWIHEGTYGIATNGSKWYPVGKFGDSFATSTSLSSSVFSSLKWEDLLNYRIPDTTKFNTTYPATYDGGLQSNWTDTSKNWRGIQYHRVTYSYKTSVIFGSTKTATAIATNKGTYYSDNLFRLEGADKWTITKNEISDNGVNWTTIDNSLVTMQTGVGKCDIVETAYREEKGSASDSIWYYGPNASSVSDTMSGHTHKTEAVGTALPYLNNSYYITDAREVDITLGYLSYPYAIGIQTPGVPEISGVNGSDFYFGVGGHATGNNSKYDHTFFSGGLRDNVTILDIKSFRDALSGKTFSLAGGYTLSYLFGDGKTGSGLNVKHTTYCSQVYNTGIVYLRGTGDGTNSDTTNSMESGKGWSLANSTNVFHQFYGTDQYRDKNGLITNENNNGPLGWDTSYHRAYFNISIREDTAPSASTSPGRTPGSTGYGVNCHPLQGTECTTVNWGLTNDEKPQAMWGTANGTLLSWFYDYENKSNSKITSVKKEFESYMWADRYGNAWTNNKNQFYDYPTQENNISSDYGFISVLSSINDVCYCDGTWIAVGNQSGKDPSQYCASYYCYTQSSGCTSGAGNAGSFVNVKYSSIINSKLVSHWIAVKVSDAKNVNFLSVVNCQGVWYLMGYIDENNNGKNDANEQAVMYWSIRPEQGFNRCITRLGSGTNNSNYSSSDTYAVYYEGDVFHYLELDGVNKMACRS